MKRVLSLLTVLAALAGSASAAGYVLPPYQAGALKSSDWMPSYNVEGLYAIGEDDAPDAWGVRGSFSLYDDGNGAVRHQFSISVAGEFGFKGDKWDKNFNGFTMGVGAGIKIFCSERLYVKVGYEFNRTFIHDELGINLNQHVITAGIGTAF